jgi:prophage maintenance system killer protein
MSEPKQLPPLKLLPNGLVCPTEALIIAIHDEIISYRKTLGRYDTAAIRDPGLIKHLCEVLTDRMHKYKKDPRENAFYIATETFYYIACQHPFHDGNKSTAYITALIVLWTNLLLNSIKVEGMTKDGVIRTIPLDPRQFRFQYNMKELETAKVNAPKEAEEITRLAEAGRDDAEVKRLIKEFLEKCIGANNG